MNFQIVFCLNLLSISLNHSLKNLIFKLEQHFLTFLFNSMPYLGKVTVMVDRKKMIL